MKAGRRKLEDVPGQLRAHEPEPRGGQQAIAGNRPVCLVSDCARRLRVEEKVAECIILIVHGPLELWRSTCTPLVMSEAK